jgi:signal transduction histidine kinase
MRDQPDSALRLLVDASTLLASSLDVEATLTKVAQLSVPTIADCCIMELTPGKTIERVVVTHVDPTKAELTAELCRRYPPTRAPDHVLSPAAAVLYDSIPDAVLRAMAHDDAHLELLRGLGMRSAIVVPMLARGETMGTITFGIASPERTYGEHDLGLAQSLADRAAFAVDNARLYQELQHAVRARDELIAIVSHDLRNPLSTITAGASVMLEDISTERIPKIARMIVRSARRMETLINDLVDLVRIDARALAVALQPIDITEILQETVEAHAELAAGKSVQLSAMSDAFTVYADHQRVLQILANLVGNAIRFTPEGGAVTLSAERIEDAVSVSVSDSGLGIPADQVPRVFERFWRGDQDDKASIGLGLSIVKGLVEAHGGTVAVASRPGKGTTFSFTLPTSIETTERPGPVVLIVDDDPSIRGAIARALTNARYRVITAANGIEALELLRTERAHLIILDLMMPRMDGIEFRVHQARDPRLAAIPTLVITAFEKLGEGMSQFEPQACIQKPFRIRELVSLVDRVVGERAGSTV